MSVRARDVVLATVTGRMVALTPIRNGSGYGPGDIRDLVRRAGVDGRSTPSTTFVGLSRLPDIEAAAEIRGIVVQRSKARTA